MHLTTSNRGNFKIWKKHEKSLKINKPYDAFQVGDSFFELHKANCGNYEHQYKHEFTFIVFFFFTHNKSQFELFCSRNGCIINCSNLSEPALRVKLRFKLTKLTKPILMKWWQCWVATDCNLDYITRLQILRTCN